MAKKFTRTEVEDIVSHYVLGLQGKISVDKAILFSSYAKGTAHEYSDIDLMVVSSELPADKLKGSNAYFLDTLVGSVNPSLEVIGVNPSNLDDPITKPFYNEILTTGVQLF